MQPGEFILDLLSFPIEPYKKGFDGLNKVEDLAKKRYGFIKTAKVARELKTKYQKKNSVKHQNMNLKCLKVQE